MREQCDTCYVIYDADAVTLYRERVNVTRPCDAVERAALGPLRARVTVNMRCPMWLAWVYTWWRARRVKHTHHCEVAQ